MTNTIRITVNGDVERVLEQLKGFYPTLDYPELFKLGLSKLLRKEELERRERWSASLPLLELSESERASLLARIGDAPEFWPAWEALEAASPVLKRKPLPAAALAREADAARLVLRGLRGASSVAAKAAALLPRVRSPGAGRGGSARHAPAG